jgi:hypothetical protein
LEFETSPSTLNEEKAVSKLFFMRRVRALTLSAGFRLLGPGLAEPSSGSEEPPY